MKPLIMLIVVATASASLGQQAKSTASLQWANEASGYHRFEEIKPKLVNDGRCLNIPKSAVAGRVGALGTVQSGHRKLGDR